MAGAKPTDSYSCGKQQGCRCSVDLKCFSGGNMMLLSMKMFLIMDTSQNHAPV